MDGMGDRPLKELDYQTPLQAANTPNMDKMAEEGINGIMDSNTRCFNCTGNHSG